MNTNKWISDRLRDVCELLASGKVTQEQTINFLKATADRIDSGDKPTPGATIRSLSSHRRYFGKWGNA